MMSDSLGARGCFHDTGSEGLGVLAVAGAQVNREVLRPVGEVMAPVMEVAHHIPVVGSAVELIGKGVHALEGKVSDGLTSVTGSRAFGDAVAPGLTQGALLAAPRIPGALRTTGRAVAEGSASVADLIRRFEIGVDRTVMGSGPAGIKVGLKPAVTEATATESAAAVSAVSEAPVSYRFQSESGVFVETPIEWTSPVGTKQTYRVFQRTDIDWSMVRTDGPKAFIGKTNREAAKAGHAPQLGDGYFATLHHMGQDSRGGLVEASRRYHGVDRGKVHDVLHNQFGRSKPHPEYPIDRPKFNQDSSAYWKGRVKYEME